MFNYIYPSPELAPYVRYYWTLEIDSNSHASERTIPAGCISLIFHKGNRMYSSTNRELQPRTFVCGHDMGFSDLVSTGSVDMICVVFHPFGARYFFDMPMIDFYGKHISFADINDKSFLEIEDRIQNTTDKALCIEHIEKFLLKRLSSIRDYNNKRLATAVGIINTKSKIGMKTLAEEVCLSPKQFNRIFTEYIGANPKDFYRIIRFQRALFFLQLNSGRSLAQLAYECGYSDQSHLIKEFKEFSGFTLTEYMNACTPYSDYFSSPG